MSREQLYARLSDCPGQESIERYDDFISRRAAGEPIAYLTGQKEFYGLSLRVDNRVLIPRPDTETLVDWVLASHSEEPSLCLHDSCTGSGAIAIALQQARPSWKVSASDISMESGELFRHNWEKIIGSPSPWQQRNLLSPLTDLGESKQTPTSSFQIITANPPYLTSKETADRLQAGWREPALALDGGREGIECARSLIVQAAQSLLPGGWLYLEAADFQIEQLCAIFKSVGFADLEYRRDLAGMKRVLRGKI